ncbi:MAG: glycerophosphodiester phosphodiesterase [Promethearchaeota archaeon]
MFNLNENEVIIIGHRGANNLAPENTLKSFRKAIEAGADYIEFDIRQSKDGEIVIMHNDDIFITTGQEGSIKKMTLEELRKLNCGEGEKIPTLQELIELARGKIGLQCEIKVPGLTEKLAKKIKEENLTNTSIISSFMFIELLSLQKLNPNLKLGLLIPQYIKSSRILKRQIQKVINNNFYSVHLYYKSIDGELVNFAHDNKLKVIVWTVNSKTAMKKIINMDIDGIITDNIQRAKEVLNRD